MKVYTLSALKFEDGNAVNEDSQYVIEHSPDKLTLWLDHFGELECGETPTLSSIDTSRCKSVRDIKRLLIKGGYIANDAEIRLVHPH